MTEDRQEAAAYTYEEAAKMLGISSATLRRMAIFYEKAFKKLPTDAKGGRIYPHDVLKRMEAARELTEKRLAGNLESAFRLVAQGNSEEVLANNQDPVEALLVEFRGIRQAMMELQTDVHLLRDENVALQEKIENQGELLKSLPSPTSDVEQKVADLEKRNQALRSALDAKEREEQERNRPWWQLWQRKKPTLGGG